MKNCTHCKHAEWDRTVNGRLHPSGVGKCKYPVEIRPLPAAFHWVGGTPRPSGGFIERKREHKEDCAYFAWADR